MSKKVRANIRCPKCNHEAPSELYRSIWVEEPQNRALILSDAINAVTCPKCKLRQRLEFPFLATNVKRRFALWYEPYPDQQIDVDAAAYRQQFGKDNFLARAPRIAGWEEFKRVLLEMEAAAPVATARSSGIPADVQQAMGWKAPPKGKVAEQRSPNRRPALLAWFSRLVRTPSEVTQTVDALKAIRPTFDASDPFVANALDSAFSAARAVAVHDSDLTIHSISVDGWKPRDLAFLLLSKASSRALSSGQYHTWRGVLGPEGNGYLKIFQKSVDELARSRFITPEQAEADIAAVKKEIKEVG